jgi:hypothetical protein
MDPNAPLTTREFTQAIWGLLFGMVAPWMIILPVWLLLDRYRDRKASREAQARINADQRPVFDGTWERQRRQELHEQYRLERLSPEERAREAAWKARVKAEEDAIEAQIAREREEGRR